MGVARHRHHPGRRAGGQAAEQGVRQYEVAEVINPEHQLEALLGQAAGPDHAGVVHQPVQRFAPGQEVRGAGPHRVQVGQVERQVKDRVVPGRGPEPGHRLLALLPRPGRDVDAPALPGQPCRGRPPDPGVGPGDQERPPVRLASVSRASVSRASVWRFAPVRRSALRLAHYASKASVKTLPNDDRGGPRQEPPRSGNPDGYSTGISLLIRPRSMPWRLRTMRATT